MYHSKSNYKNRLGYPCKLFSTQRRVKKTYQAIDASDDGSSPYAAAAALLQECHNDKMSCLKSSAFPIMSTVKKHQ